MTKIPHALSKLRVSSHRLEVESDRWVRPRRIPVHKRKCIVCQVVEDEFHFIIECPLYTELRRKYNPNYYYRRPSMLKFVELINTHNSRLLNKNGIFYLSCF